MPRSLTPQELVLLQQDTDFLHQEIPVWGSRVVNWMNRFVLIYHTQNLGYVLTDITDLGQAAINELAKKSEVHGMWYFLPQSIMETISDEAETAIEVAKTAGKAGAEILQSTADAIGKAAADLLKPLIDALMIPIVILGAIGMIYLIKKG